MTKLSDIVLKKKFFEINLDVKKTKKVVGIHNACIPTHYVCKSM